MLALAVAFLLLVISIVGCSGNGTTDGNKGIKKQRIMRHAEPSPEATVAPEENQYDLKGQTIKIGVWYDGADPRLVEEKGPGRGSAN